MVALVRTRTCCTQSREFRGAPPGLRAFSTNRKPEYALAKRITPRRFTYKRSSSVEMMERSLGFRENFCLETFVLRTHVSPLFI